MYVYYFCIKTWKGVPNPKVYGDLALLGDWAKGYSQ